MTSVPYKIRFVCLDSIDIHNPIKPPRRRVKRMNSENQWFERLEASILKYGILNPLVVDARIKLGNIKLTCRYGGSRLMVAQEHSLIVPCIVADHNEIYSTAKTLIDENEIRKYYNNQPKELEIRESTIYMTGCSDFHMKKAK